MVSENSYNKLRELVENVFLAHNAYIERVLLMSTSLFGILIALHKTPIQNLCVRIFYCSSLILLLAGIIFLTAALQQRLRFLFDQLEKNVNLMDEKSSVQDYNHIFKIGHPSKILLTLERIAYILLALAVICLTVYGILIA